MCNKTEVTVGLSISLTGRFRPQGQQVLQGIRLWQSYINAQGGIAVSIVLEFQVLVRRRIGAHRPALRWW